MTVDLQHPSRGDLHAALAEYRRHLEQVAAAVANMGQRHVEAYRAAFAPFFRAFRADPALADRIIREGRQRDRHRRQVAQALRHRDQRARRHGRRVPGRGQRVASGVTLRPGATPRGVWLDEVQGWRRVGPPTPVFFAPPGTPPPATLNAPSGWRRLGTMS